jgi:hypothetical protein
VGILHNSWAGRYSFSERLSDNNRGVGSSASSHTAALIDVYLMLFDYKIESDGIHIKGCFISRIIEYENIKCITKANLWQVMGAACRPLGPLMTSLPNGIALHFVLIETKDKRLTAITPNNCDAFIELTSKYLTNKAEEVTVRARP